MKEHSTEEANGRQDKKNNPELFRKSASKPLPMLNIAQKNETKPKMKKEEENDAASSLYYLQQGKKQLLDHE